jgi:hypothetical protein
LRLAAFLGDRFATFLFAVVFLAAARFFGERLVDFFVARFFVAAFLLGDRFAAFFVDFPAAAFFLVDRLAAFFVVAISVAPRKRVPRIRLRLSPSGTRAGEAATLFWIAGPQELDISIPVLQKHDDQRLAFGKLAELNNDGLKPPNAIGHLLYFPNLAH